TRATGFHDGIADFYEPAFLYAGHDGATRYAGDGADTAGNRAFPGRADVVGGGSVYRACLGERDWCGSPCRDGLVPLVRRQASGGLILRTALAFADSLALAVVEKHG